MYTFLCRVKFVQVVCGSVKWLLPPLTRLPIIIIKSNMKRHNLSSSRKISVKLKVISKMKELKICHVVNIIVVNLFSTIFHGFCCLLLCELLLSSQSYRTTQCRVIEKSIEKFINGLFDSTDFHTTQSWNSDLLSFHFCENRRFVLAWIRWNAKRNEIQIDCYLHLSGAASSWLIVIKNDLSFLFFICAKKNNSNQHSPV